MKMKWWHYIILIGLLPTLASAQPRKTKRKRVKPSAGANIQKAQEPPAEATDSGATPEVAPSEGSSSTPSAGASRVRRPYWSSGVGLLLWQEAVELKRPGSTAKMQTQFKGLNFQGAYNRTRSNSYWQEYYGFELGYGTLKGQGDQPAITDRLDNQSWILLTLKPGLIYRTSPVSRVGIMLPVVYRKIQWNFNPGSGLEAGDKAFSVGVGFHYVQRVSKDSSVDFALTHQKMWATNLWSAAWNYEF